MSLVRVSDFIVGLLIEVGFWLLNPEHECSVKFSRQNRYPRLLKNKKFQIETLTDMEPQKLPPDAEFILDGSFLIKMYG